MPIKSYKLKGTLTLGATPLDVSCQVTSVSVNPTENVDTEDALHVLCGDVLPASDTVSYAYTLSGTLLQDLSTGGVVDYTWDNAGDEVPFSFTPDDTGVDVVAGTVRLIPLTIGGEVTARPTSDFEWAIIGTPTFTPSVAAGLVYGDEDETATRAKGKGKAA
jgi:hypothetical protein